MTLILILCGTKAIGADFSEQLSLRCRVAGVFEELNRTYGHSEIWGKVDGVIDVKDREFSLRLTIPNRFSEHAITALPKIHSTNDQIALVSKWQAPNSQAQQMVSIDENYLSLITIRSNRFSGVSHRSNIKCRVTPGLSRSLATRMNLL